MSELMPENKNLTIPGVESPLAYSIAFDWGGLHVSQRAHEQTQLQPLVPEIIKGGSFNQDKGRPQFEPKIDVFIVSPDEMLVTNAGELCARSELYKNGIGLVMSFMISKEEIKQNYVYDIVEKAQFAHEESISIDDIVDENDIPIDESIQQLIPEHMAVNLARVTDEHISKRTSHWLESNGRKQQYDGIKKSSTISLLGMASAGATASLLEIPVARVIAVPAYIAFSGIMFQKYIKSSFKLQELKQINQSTIAQQVGAVVGSDVYRVFSSNHFNASTSKLLLDEDL